MNDIKIIEGLAEWEVMKRASEGEPVATKSGLGELVKCHNPVWNWFHGRYWIIDTSAHEIDLDDQNRL